MNKTLIAVPVLALAGCLLMPDVTPASLPPGEAEAFIWDQDDVWSRLEGEFNTARNAGCADVNADIDRGLKLLNADLQWLQSGEQSPDDPGLDVIEAHLFKVAPLIAACPVQLPAMLDVVNRLRAAIKLQSRSWDVGSAAARQRVYRLLYGARMTTEEILLQGAALDVPDLVLGTDVPSETPSVIVRGLRVHSGDILVSRGGAPVSAFIARGNDYPGNFSHIALLHVDEHGEVNVVEAQIEEGVTISTLDEYLTDTKLRLMVLRLDAELPAIRDDPLLPHRAATAALNEARERHVPYDFAMYYQDPSKKFCSEVASAAFADQGVNLWEGLTTMSSTGTRSWLSALGVKQFETHGPSDLEYDPKLVVVAEWRDLETLFGDHVDSAVIDAMLEGADRGDEVDYAYRYLPIARVMKAYSALLNVSGRQGPVPEGMSATTALRSKWLDARHAELKANVMLQVEAFRARENYTPPYWQLVSMARAELATKDQ